MDMAIAAGSNVGLAGEASRSDLGEGVAIETLVTLIVVGVDWVALYL